MPRTLGTLYKNLQSAFSFVSSCICYGLNLFPVQILFQTVKRLVVQYMNSQKRVFDAVEKFTA